MRNGLQKYLLILVVIALSGTSAFGQHSTGSITGTVIDPQGTVVAVSRDAPRHSLVNGLPKGAANISMDGINVQDNLQIKFVTHGGANDYHGGVYWYHRNPALNANFWFNNRDICSDSSERLYREEEAES